ncbi:MAG: DoxX family protein [Myxococcota bacterium]
MDRYLAVYSDRIYASLRIVVGLLFAFHGAQKLLDWPTPGPDPLPALMIVAGLVELVGGALVAAGLFASWAAFICSGQMAAAYFMAHFPNGFFPIVNRGELAVLYAFVFLYIAARGAGPWSLAPRGAAG